MDSKQLEYFLKVYERGSFLSAAQALFITQQGLNQSIKRLEKELQTPLFFRTSHGLQPTEAGRKLYRYARPYLAQWKHALADVTDPTDASEHTLHVAFDIGTMELIPPHFLSSYMAGRKEENLFFFNSLNACQELVMKGEADVGFCQPPIDTAFLEEVFTLYRPIVIAVHKDHPLAAKTSLRVSDLRNCRLVDLDLDAPAQRYYKEVCRREGIRPAILLNASQGAQLAEFVSKNVAVSFYAGDPRWLHDDVKLIPFSDMHISFGYHMVIKKGGQPKRLLTDFLAAFQSAVSDDGLSLDADLNKRSST